MNKFLCASIILLALACIANSVKIAKNTVNIGLNNKSHDLQLECNEEIIEILKSQQIHNLHKE